MGSHYKLRRASCYIREVLKLKEVGLSAWIFPSFQLKGKRPRVANMLVEDYLRPEAMKAGILSSYRNDEGKLVENDARRFGFHNLRHSLASFLVRITTDPKTVQTLLRRSDVKFTLQFYTHSISDDRMAAAGAMLTAIPSHTAEASGLGADSGTITAS